MASSSRRHSYENSRQSSFPVKGPQFFKIIHHGVVHDRKLRIPREFIERYGNHLSNTVFLKVPSGDVWTVQLGRSDGNVWLQNGWQEFKEHYSIRYGHFLVFRYDGNSHFHVLIFDRSASEIEYPFSATPVQQTNNSGGCKVQNTDIIEVEDDSVEILNDFPTIQTREKIPEFEQKKDVFVRLSDDFPTRRTTSKTMPYCEAMITNRTIRTENTTNCEALLSDFQSRRIQTNGVKFAKLNADGDNSKCLRREIKKECIEGIANTPRHRHTNAPERRSADEKERALQRAKDYKSEDPFFVVFMQPSYVTARIILNIPYAFAKKYFTHKQKIELGVSNVRTWSVECCFGSGHAKFSSGWRSFVWDNHLKVGDVCVFRLIKGGIEPLLEVIVF